eukprot:1183219-Prorocentrum_minimum.AAC.3
MSVPSPTCVLNQLPCGPRLLLQVPPPALVHMLNPVPGVLRALPRHQLQQRRAIQVQLKHVLVILALPLVLLGELVGAPSLRCRRREQLAGELAHKGAGGDTVPRPHPPPLALRAEHLQPAP